LRTGKLGIDRTVAEAREDAHIAGLRILSLIRSALGSLDGVETIVKLYGMVNATDTFGEHPQVIDGCSELLIEIFGENGRHARSAVGHSSLPGGMSVEIEAIIRIAPGY
jgi:enamine deaminase RidA (YjgF/YER057c/UK114 family)